MCTVVAAIRYFDNIPLIIAANRDEFKNRKTDPPSLINQNPLILAPRDRLKLGTFIGVNEWGLTAVITNLSGLIPRDNSKKSRGHLVLRALGSPDVNRLLSDFEHIDFSEYNFFQIFAADNSKAVLIRYKGDIEIKEYESGIFSFSNWDAIPEVSDYKNSLIMSKIDRIEKNSDINDVVAILRNILSLHDGEDMRFQICVHTENYGTLSSAIIAPFQSEPVFYYSEGPVCQNRFRAYNQDLKSILTFRH
ncbi:MAG: NRDE family protein [Deltaproteobacteria bacterium]|nr:NRDE family protein [Deltaproteobacteria bacterium]